jgi:probable dihydroxyacetone kinase regulator
VERKPTAAADRTKHALAAALKELMSQKPIDKISIHDLTESCGIRRQTFYYHYEDVYDLLRWMFQEEAVALLKQHEGTLLWQEGLLQLLHYIEDNRAVCLCALKSVGRDHLKRFFQADIYAVIHSAVEQIGMGVGAMQAGVTSDEIALMTHIYVVAVAGVIESWLLGEIERTPEQMVTFADQMFQDHIRGAKIRWSEAAKTP